jgi:flagellar biosynthesis/type III secretory pathway chaperone
MERSYGKDRKRKQYQDKGTGSVMPAGDSMPDTYIAIMLQSLKKKEQVLDEIIRLDDRQKDTLTDPECPFDVFDETVEAKSACIDQLNQLDSGFEKLYAQVAEELDQNREDYAKEIRDMQQCIRRVTDKSVKIQAQEARNKELMREKFATIHRQAKAVRKNSRAITGYYNSMKEW